MSTTSAEDIANYRMVNDTLTMIHTDAGYYTPVTSSGGAGVLSYMHVWYLKDHLAGSQYDSNGNTTVDVGNLVYRDGLLGRIFVEGGSIVAKDSTMVPAYEFAFTDHLGSIRSLVTVGDSLFRKTEYGPYGEVLSENWTSILVLPGGGSGGNGGSGPGGEEEEGVEEEDEGGSGGPRRVSIIQTRLDSPYRYGGKERLDVSGLDMYDFGARHYTPSLPRWLTMDPLAEKYYSISPYAYCADDPVNLVDPEGCAPIYNQLGFFMGTDDEGIQGSAIIMSSDLFIQGMTHEDALTYDLGFKGLASVESVFSFLRSYSKLSERPDYDGFVTIEEGIQWAKEHPGVLNRNNPEDALYFDASKVDFGNVSTEEFVKSPQQINVFRGKSIISYMIHPAQRHSAYALGQVDMELLDREERSVRIINGKGTVYDWDLNGNHTRKTLITLERMRTGLNDSHGFRVYYYGIGYLKK